MVRKMEVMKMRGQASLPGLHTFRKSSAGIEVFPPAGAAIPAGALPRSEPPGDRLLVGVPRLDEMLGGGLPRGYSLLIAAPLDPARASWRRPSWPQAPGAAKPE
jgi:circadian clock protein KaiC